MWRDSIRVMLLDYCARNRNKEPLVVFFSSRLWAGVLPRRRSHLAERHRSFVRPDSAVSGNAAWKSPGDSVVR
jgi:hypothetical protein